ncbi:MAG: hypothetical protein HQL51_06580 [Magnetococcales bacterium]|nr:hypothetical protein [Magnetococcales bacterium]
MTLLPRRQPAPFAPFAPFALCALTAHAPTEYEQRSREAGGDGRVAKPTHKARLSPLNPGIHRSAASEEAVSGPPFPPEVVQPPPCLSPSPCVALSG